MMKICKKHGLTEHSETTGKRKRLRCKKCRVIYVKKRRDKIKNFAIDYKGGKCNRCGYDKCLEALEFHHIDPEQKDFEISTLGYRNSLERLKKELDKCELLCANCHREEHHI